MICKTCGGEMVGDGFQNPIHCENVDISFSAYKPDCNPIHCQPRLFNTNNVAFDDYISKQLETSFFKEEWKNKPNQINELPQAVRLALHLYYNVKLTLLGAVLRTKYKNHPATTKYYEPWTQEETEHWEIIQEEFEKLFYAVSEDEKDYLKQFIYPLSSLTRGETIQEFKENMKKWDNDPNH